jgi:hypothetical protein
MPIGSAEALRLFRLWGCSDLRCLHSFSHCRHTVSSTHFKTGLSFPLWSHCSSGLQLVSFPLVFVSVHSAGDEFCYAQHRPSVPRSLRGCQWGHFLRSFFADLLPLLEAEKSRMIPNLQVIPFEWESLASISLFLSLFFPPVAEDQTQPGCWLSPSPSHTWIYNMLITTVYSFLLKMVFIDR